MPVNTLCTTQNPRSNQCFFHFASLNYSLFFEATRGAVNKFVFLKQQKFGVSRVRAQPKKRKPPVRRLRMAKTGNDLRF